MVPTVWQDETNAIQVRIIQDSHLPN
ncbi:uncharacterized protein METZ01_LOCUS194906 [marine metagenome]|uniref:Uncharacterized protein n=1 Tax=marine metagenome TaxID=408172 RepID=A0A382DVC4_9ZZZZ